MSKITKAIPSRYAELARENEIPYQYLWNRVNRLGWRLHEAATIPINKHSVVEENDLRPSTIAQLAYLIQNSRDRKSPVECRADFIDRLKVQFADDPEVMKYLSSVKA